MERNDLTVVFYTANAAPDSFTTKVRQQLLLATEGLPLISVSQVPMDFGENICVGDIGRSHLNIYRQALIGVKAAKTKYIALSEDDVLYHADHFKHVPSPGVFAYNMNVWSYYTWEPSTFSYKDRVNLSGLICERDLFIRAMEERFKRWPNDNKTPIHNWAEPGKYETNLGVTVQKIEKFYPDNPNLAFSHPTALSYQHLGKRKRLGKIRATEIPFWGHVSKINNVYA